MCNIWLYTFPFLSDKEPNPKCHAISKKEEKPDNDTSVKKRQVYKSSNTEANPQGKVSDHLKSNSSNFPFWYRTEKSETQRITSSIRLLQVSGPNTCSKQSQLQSQIKSLEASSPSSLPRAF